MKYPKKPKLKSLPKRPKASATVQTWEIYEKRCQEVQKENATKLKNWESDKKKIDLGLKKKQKIQEKTKGIGRM
ncbi:MAG: hypothetical protein KAT68_00695 [Bacteroidales bacterium]|nr:hypothetical protein [Bacteroidales bacterium]